MTKTATVKLTAAIGVAGELMKRGSVITIPESAAKDLLRRGKAEMATADDEAAEELADASEEQAEPATDEAAADSAEPAKKTGKKK
ncbi:hypothetical protein [Aquabacterium sp.]|uniref:hypothetical protein n=1 Tax=Aquabacterium sp. TaxID=1872578 RepID=UPI0025C37383|nr:hypothetical protein [Aquabacterium sp.]